MSHSLTGFVELSSEIMVRSELLGRRFSGASGGYEFNLVFPKMPPMGDAMSHPDLVDPSPPSFDVGNYPLRWGYVGSDLARVDLENAVAYVSTLAFELIRSEQPQDEAEPAGTASHFGSEFDGWFRRAADWFELWSGQRLAVEGQPGAMRSYGQAWDQSGQRTGWGHGGTAYVYRADAALTLAHVESGFDRATREVSPSDAWVLILRARRASDPRRSVIDAGTASEVCLSRELHARLNNLPEEARERVIFACNGVVGMTRLLEDIDSVDPSQSLWRRVADRLASPRNAAVHAGTLPDGTHASALAEATRILNAYAPLPGPDV